MSDFESDGFRCPDSLESDFESSTIQFGTPDRLSLIYSTMKHCKSTLQPRTAFSYKTPAQERVTAIQQRSQGQVKKRLDTSEVPNTEGGKGGREE